MDNETMSEATIYKEAVAKRISSSSEDDMILELSDESLNNSNPFYHIADPVRPGTSHEKTRKVVPEGRLVVPQPMSIKERTEKHNRDAEAAKAKIFPPPGKDLNPINFEFIAMMDQDYLLVGSHVDEQTRLKVVKGEYVDFCKLLPKDKMTPEDEGSRMELIMKNGRTFWTPASSDNVAINNYGKWEQAFRVFSNIYTQAHPGKSTELIQYNHIIHSIATSYIWENVYAYDKEFRMHLSRHQERNWGGG